MSDSTITTTTTEDTDYEGSESGKLTKLEANMQNRDIVKWVNRLERAEKFRDSAHEFIELMCKSIVADSIHAFEDNFAEKHELKTVPYGVYVDVKVSSPAIKKVLPEGERFFSQYKEYPFYYILNVDVVFNMNSMNDEMRKNNEFYTEWYGRNLAESVENQVLGRIRSNLYRKFSSNIINFPKSLLNVEDLVGKININMTSSLKVSKSTAFRPNKSSMNAALENKDVKGALAETIAMALSRLI